MSDIQDLKRSINILDFIGARYPLKKKGSEHVCHCPRHEDKSASLTINEKKQVWLCPPCGESGDVIDFIQFADQVDTSTAIKTLREFAGEDIHQVASGSVHVRNTPKNSPSSEWKTVLDFELTTVPTFSHFTHGKPDRVFPYRNQANKIIGYVCRFDLEDGKKEIIPFTFCENEKGERRWKWRGFDTPRPLYGLQGLDPAGKKTVLLVEGEKAQEAAQALFPHVCAIAWCGGTGQWQNADWSPLRGRKVLFWPDKDEAGRKVMSAIMAYFQEHNLTKLNRWIIPPLWAPRKWDIADAEGWTKEQAREYARNNLSETPPTDEQLEQSEVQSLTPVPAEPPVQSSVPRVDVEHPQYFDFMGYEKTATGSLSYKLYSKRARMVLSLGSGNPSRTQLQQFAPLHFWEQNFPGRQSIDMNQAINWITNRSLETGIFDEERIRGCGAWLDEGRIVVHNGDSLLVNGVRMSLGDLDSEFIYEARVPLNISLQDPMNSTESAKVIEAFGLLTTKRPVDAYLLAGWCAIAPVCGALQWRPHLWLTGSAGTGKSWVMQELVRPMLGRTGLQVQSSTTEPGIRQRIRMDARPVIFDEFEPTDRDSVRRQQAILGLARSSSSKDGGDIVKGTAAHVGHSFRVRSCFIFASIVTGIKQHSDRTRITVVEMMKPEGGRERWDRLQALQEEIGSAKYIQRLQARTVRNLPQLVTNAKTFSKAVAIHLNDQRIGDQVGALLAGAYSLMRTDAIRLEDALKWVEARDWTAEREIENRRDEESLIGFILQQEIRIEDIDGRNVDRSIAEIIAAAMQWKTTDTISVISAQARLVRLGIRVESSPEPKVNIAAKHTALEKMLRDTPWSTGYGKVLSRMNGSEKTGPKYIGPGKRYRTVELDVRIIQEIVRSHI